MAIESANIVGYQNKALAGGYNFTLSTFQAVNGVATLGDIKCNEAVTLGGTDLQLLDDIGATAKVFVDEEVGEVDAIFWYMPKEFASEEVPEGWYLVVEDAPYVSLPQNGREIPSGQAFLMNCGDGGAVVTLPSAL